MQPSFPFRPVAVRRQFVEQPQLALVSGAVLAEAATRARVDVAACEVPRFEAAAGLLRAADQAEVPLSVSIGSFFGSQTSARCALDVSRALVATAAACRFRPPLVLATTVDAAQTSWDLEPSQSRLASLIDAGFTSFAFPVPSDRAELEHSVALMREVQQQGLGLELIEVPAGGSDKVLRLFAGLGLELCALRELGSHRSIWIVDGRPVAQEVSARIHLPAVVLDRVIARALDVDHDEVAFAPIDAHLARRVEALSFVEFSSLLRRTGLGGGAGDCVEAMFA